MSVVNYRRLQHHYKDEYGEHGGWVTRRAKRRESIAAQEEIQQQLEEMEDMDSIYVVVQAYKPNDSEYELMDLSGTYHLTEVEAREELRHIAAEYDVEVMDADSTFTVPTPIKGLEYDLYYIEELIRG